MLVSPHREPGSYRKYWLCVCACGNTKPVREDNLVSGRAHSCGCQKYIRTNGHANQMSGITVPASEQRYRVEVWTTSPQKHGTRFATQRTFGVVWAKDADPMDYNLTIVFGIKNIGSNSNPRAGFILARMAHAGYIGRKQGRPTRQWAEEEGVSIKEVGKVSFDEIDALQKSMAYAAQAAGYDAYSMEQEYYAEEEDRES